MDAAHPTQTFLLEARELLDQIEEIALDAEQRPGDPEAINRLFRAFHTIKGSGAMFGFEAVAGFTHHVETALDRIRSGHTAVSRRFVELILAARDHITALLDDPAEAAPERAAALISAFNEDSGDPAVPVPTATAAPSIAGHPMAWRIKFRPPANIGTIGLDPTALLEELRQLGACTIAANLSAVPLLDQLQAEHCHVSWDITLRTSQGLNAIKDVFIFIENDSELTIEPIVETSPVTPAHPPLPLRRANGGEPTVRVPSDRLDRLVNLVGEFVMNQSRLTQSASRVEDPELNVPVEELERLISDLRETVLGIRMMPIGTTFGRFRRVVHDLSLELHKEIELVTEGAETELDKTVLDQLGDPLVHLIRNSIDHGIEPPDERVRAGKPRRGTIRLCATHTGSSVVITIQDDGRGLDTAAIRAKAIEKKLVAPDANLSPRESFNMILLPGFSTASAVTSVSGRGVGMDVVKREIEALRGTLQIESKPGLGTTISATLPLTLAIIDGLHVALGGDRFIIPVSAVQENVELPRSDRLRNNGRNTIAIRGELVPYLRLRESFGFPDDGPAVEKVVIVHHGSDRVGLVVDRVLGSHQTVIQSLGRFYRKVGAFSGATIQGDGRVALILDLAGIIHLAGQPPASSPHSS